MDESKSILKPGQRCVIIGGCPENIGLIVEVVCRVRPAGGHQDLYEIETISGRDFQQLWRGKNLTPGNSSRAYTQRHKLRPLADPGDIHVDVFSYAKSSKANEFDHRNGLLEVK